MDDVIGGDRGLFKECDREKAAALSSGLTSQMRSTQHDMPPPSRDPF